jgi:hypothetical protein
MILRVTQPVTLGRILSILLLAIASAFAQDSSQQKKEDTFFAGTVASFDPQKVVVARSVSAKTEQKTFRMTPETKVEGKLRAKVRVTVRYVTDEDGDIATLIVVRQTKQK